MVKRRRGSCGTEVVVVPQRCRLRAQFGFGLLCAVGFVFSACGGDGGTSIDGIASCFEDEGYDVTTDEDEFPIGGTFEADGVQAESDNGYILVFLAESGDEANVVEGLARMVIDEGPSQIERRGDAVVIYGERDPGRAEEDAVDKCI